MDPSIIRKGAAIRGVEPNLRDYESARTSFRWEDARARLSGLPDERGLNIAYEAVDRHAEGELADKVAIRWLSADGEQHDFTYARLRDLTNRFANALGELGVGKGDRVFVLSSRVPELYIAMLGTLKNGSVFSPLFSAFGPEPIRQRVESGDGKVLVTTPALYRDKVAQIRDELPELEHVLLIPSRDETSDIEGTLDLGQLLDEASVDFEIAPTDPQDMALLHFTSGTTGKPKGAVHVHEAVVAHHITGEFALDFHPDDIFWCTADPGWVTGTSYGIISPLTHGLTMVVDEAEYSAQHWYSVLEEHQVSVWYTAPTAIRMLMKAGSEAAEGFDLSALRFIASVGEPLNPEAVVWGDETFGMPIHDNWWQTETGGIMISNYASMDIKPGSMGKPLPGIEAAIVERNDDGVEVVTDDREGELALKPGWPSMFRGYLHNEEKYRNSFVDGWYLSGDMARRDADGYFWFVGRADDMIKSAGHLIGPFEVESTLIEHPAVAEAGVIGVPHRVAGEIVKAFVSLHKDYEPSKELRRELMGFARTHLGSTVAPREIEFADSLPKTRSGKIMRRLLKARELGLPEGDTSTLERE
ncbi:acetate--CoA ligase [Persicimonas caeni]|uniref:acetate--CoA ligase n=1 Tax=Persicimonas caeni TaxID=2292766 RepID=A0A4Y6PZG5_PERCE|nr:acetate--CoA ligase [Persicimonas caeni]QDG53653.1 acetate--CoA ligase [Persicimonas caeni]QED34874.1 acetate--CoA ligase [Persicimonas caeni]